MGESERECVRVRARLDLPAFAAQTHENCFTRIF